VLIEIILHCTAIKHAALDYNEKKETERHEMNLEVD